MNEVTIPKKGIIHALAKRKEREVEENDEKAYETSILKVDEKV